MFSEYLSPKEQKSKGIDFQLLVSSFYSLFLVCSKKSQEIICYVFRFSEMAIENNNNKVNIAETIDTKFEMEDYFTERIVDKREINGSVRFDHYRSVIVTKTQF